MPSIGTALPISNCPFTLVNHRGAMAPIRPNTRFHLLVIFSVLIGAWVVDAGAIGIDDVDGRWLSNTMEVLKERRQEMKKGEAPELDPRLVLAENNRRVITVRQDGTGDFKTVTAAVESVKEGNTRRIIIKIGKGVYKEKLTVPREKKYLTFYGESADQADMPVITSGGTAKEFGTIYSATVAVESNHFMAVNIIFENTAPMPAPGEENGQALAFRISGDKASFFNCRFYGYQDTLCDWMGKHFFYGCYIRGTVDFVFGNGRSIYMKSELHSVAKETQTALTAQGREAVADKSGFSFVNCEVGGEGKTGTALLSRAWRPRAMVVFSFTNLGSIINPNGWGNMGHADRDQTVVYGEYKCSGPGATTKERVGYGKILNENQARNYYNPSFIKAKTWLLSPPEI